MDRKDRSLGGQWGGGGSFECKVYYRCIVSCVKCVCFCGVFCSLQVGGGFFFWQQSCVLLGDCMVMMVTIVGDVAPAATRLANESQE